MKKQKRFKIFLPVILLLGALFFYSAASAYQPKYDLTILKQHSFNRYDFRGLTWDGQYVWYSGIDNILQKFDIESGSEVSNFQVPINIRALDWDGENLLAADNNSIRKYSTTGTFLAIYHYSFELKRDFRFSVNDIAWDADSEGGPYIWFAIPDRIVKAAVGPVLNVVETIETTDFTTQAIAWDGQNLWLSVSLPSYGYPLPKCCDRIWKYDPVSKTVLEEYATPAEIQIAVQGLDWATDPTNGPTLIASYQNAFIDPNAKPTLYQFIVGTEAWQNTYLPMIWEKFR